MKRFALALLLASLAACGSDEPPAEQPPAEPDGGVLGEPLLDAQRRANEAVEQAESRKRELDRRLEELDGRNTDEQ